MNGSGSAELPIFGLTYVVLGLGALPPLRVDRTGATLIGTTAMVGFGVLTPNEAAAAMGTNLGSVTAPCLSRKSCTTMSRPLNQWHVVRACCVGVEFATCMGGSTR